MTLAGPRREDEQDAGAVRGGDRAPLVHVEREEAAGSALDDLPAAVHADRPVHDGNERTLLHLMVSELLTGIEHDQHGAGSVVRAQHDGGAAAAGRIDLAEVPTLHGRDPKRARGSRLTSP